MINDKVVQLYASEDDILYSGYEYVEPEVSLDLENLLLFRKSIQRMNKTLDYYLKERAIDHGNPKINALEEANEIAELKYDFTNVEAGLRPINILDYSYQTILCRILLDNTLTIKEEGFSKDDLKEILKALKDSKINFCSDKTKSELLPNNYSDNYIIDINEIETVTNLTIFSSFVTNIFKIFERTQVTQARDDFDWRIIKWNIREDMKLDSNDYLSAADYAGLLYLRKLELIKYLPETFKLQRVIENYELNCLKDEFRYQFAGMVGILDYDKAEKIIASEFKTNSFEAQYKTLPSNTKRKFDIESRIFLKNIAVSNNLEFHLGV